jgi:peroxiredoxin
VRSAPRRAFLDEALQIPCCENAMHAVNLILMLAMCAAPGEPVDSPVGRKIDNFQLRDYLGSPHELSDWQGRKAVVIVFLGTECPLARLYGSRLAKLADEFAEKDVAIIGINSNCQDSLAEIGHYARSQGIEFPILKDTRHEVADQFGAQRTPEAFVLDRDNVVRYWGRIDDQYGVGYVKAEAQHNYVAAAIANLLDEKPVATPVTEPVGCRIGRAPEPSSSGEVNYTRHIAAILQKHCVECHRPGQVAPFSLTSYNEVVGWGETIREVIEQQRMPPWHANPEHGKFLNDARLPDEAKATLFRWLDLGMPEGEPADLPQPATFVDGWRIPQPDMVFKMPQPFKVPARGTVPYKYFTIDPKFTEDKWLLAAEARPGNAAVTHHLILFYHPPGKQRISPEEPLFNALAAFAPGLPPARYDVQAARRIPAGSKLVIQAHYTPNGTEQLDQSQIGIVFADPQAVKRELSIQAGINILFRIPPGAGNHRVQTTHRFDRDTIVFSMTPHMHLRGKSFRFEAIYPDKSREILLDVPRYDFNWQNYYVLAEPKVFPAGSQIEMVAHFDNSAENLANPDPTKTVMFGEQTWEEMMVGTMATSPLDQDLSLGLPRAEKISDQLYRVRFAYRPGKTVEGVYLAGSFNEWKKDGLKMDGPDADGVYTASVELKPGKHEYKFVVDGQQWRDDPNNPVKSGVFGNSLLQVGDSP